MIQEAPAQARLFKPQFAVKKPSSPAVSSNRHVSVTLPLRSLNGGQRRCAASIHVDERQGETHLRVRSGRAA
jgi:hypothetical protein